MDLAARSASGKQVDPLLAQPCTSQAKSPCYLGPGGRAIGPFRPLLIMATQHTTWKTSMQILVYTLSGSQFFGKKVTDMNENYDL